MNMLMNEDSVLPVLLADRTPSCQGAGGGQRPSQVLPSGSQRCPDQCSEWHLTPHPEVLLKQALHFQKPLLPWRSSKQSLGLVTSFPNNLPSPALLPA